MLQISVVGDAQICRDDFRRQHFSRESAAAGIERSVAAIQIGADDIGVEREAHGRAARVTQFRRRPVRQTRWSSSCCSRMKVLSEGAPYAS